MKATHLQLEAVRAGSTGASPDGYTGSVLAAGDVSATVWWKCDEARPARLGDPTPLLEPMATAVFDMASYQPGEFSVG
jgi:hypothetical protein